MNREQWQRLQSILAQALDLPPQERAALIDSLCAGDETLRAEALELLAHSEALPESLPTWLISEWARDQDGDQWIGRTIGAFVIEERLGSGGSSVVFRARRASNFSQQVAIKLLRSAAGETLVARFLREREILATLHHPHIAQLYDAGTSDDGTPYLVLEYVDGVSWDRWLRDATPALPQVLQHFLSVCDAVRYAHQRLFVHRDIKPANLLIDRADTPKLLDFGIAKLLADSHNSELTRELGNSFTPAYAAPEQIDGGAVTTATDVHALGVLLYESLSGKHPYRSSGDGDQQTLRAVMESEPGKPSTALGDSILARAAPALRADLDNIVLTAIEKDPARRYAGVSELAADIRAALAGHPIAARTHTWRYLAGKFVRRHRLPVLVTTLALAAVLTASATALWQARIAVQERAVADRRFDQVRQFTHNILFDYHEGIQKLPGSLPMQQRLVQDSLAYLEALQKEAGNDALLWQDIAEAWMKTGNLQGNPYVSNLGDFKGAERSYAQAEAALAQVPDNAGGTVRAILQARLLANQAHLDYRDGELDRARARYEASIAIFEAMAESDRALTDIRLEYADTLDNLGDLLGRDGQNSLMQIERARATYLQSAEVRAAALAAEPDNPQVRYAVYKSRLREGEYWAGQGDMQRAETELLATLALIQSLHAENPDDSYRRREVALVRARLVPVQDALDKIPESIDNALEAVRIMDAMFTLDPDNDSMRQGLSASCGWAARQLIKAGRYVEAGPVIERQIQISRERLQAVPGNAEVEFSLSLALRRLGEQQAGLGQYADAIATHQNALALQEKLTTLGADYALSHALSLLHIGRNQLAADRVDAARRSLADAAQRIAALLAEYPEANRYRSTHAEMLDAGGDAWLAGNADRKQAAAHYRDALASWDAYALNAQLSPAESRQRNAVAAKLTALR